MDHESTGGQPKSENACIGNGFKNGIDDGFVGGVDGCLDRWFLLGKRREFKSWKGSQATCPLNSGLIL